MSQRYMIVEYPKQDGDGMHVTPEGKLKNHLPIHELLGSYHFVRLDDDHVLVNGDFPIGHSVKLDKHPAVLVLPHVASAKSISVHGLKFNRTSHANALVRNLSDKGITASSTMSDILDEVSEKFGPVFMPNR